MAKHHFDKKHEDDLIREEIIRLSKVLKRTPTQKLYKLHRDKNSLTPEQITYRFGSWSEAVKFANLEPNPFQKPPRSPEITEKELVDDFIKVANSLGKIPGALQFRAKSKYSWTPYKTKWCSWRNAVNFIISKYSERFTFKNISISNKKTESKRRELEYECSLLFRPTNEYETVILFAYLAKDLGYKIKSVGSAFPDAILLDSKNKEIPVEFEYLSSNYLQHSHPLDFKGICICWRNDQDLKNIKVLSLEEHIEACKKSGFMQT